MLEELDWCNHLYTLCTLSIMDRHMARSKRSNLTASIIQQGRLLEELDYSKHLLSLSTLCIMDQYMEHMKDSWVKASISH